MSPASPARPDPFVGATPRIDAATFRWTVGIRAEPTDAWLVNDEHLADDLSAKAAVLSGHHDEAVFESLPQFGDQGTAAADELRDLAIATAQSQGRTVACSESPMDDLARGFAEDFMLLLPQDDQWVLSAATVCFTSRWNLRSKLGLDVTGIHGPVPDYEHRLEPAVDKTFDRIADDDGSTVFARTNWTLLDDDQLHLPLPANSEPPIDPTHAVYLRTERQTLRRLPNSGSIAFTILTRVTPTDELSETRRRELDALLRTVPDDIADYRGWITQTDS